MMNQKKFEPFSFSCIKKCELNMFKKHNIDVFLNWMLTLEKPKTYQMLKDRNVLTINCIEIV